MTGGGWRVLPCCALGTTLGQEMEVKAGVAIATPDVGHTKLALLSGSFEEKLDKAVALGCSGVELVMRDPAELDVSALCENIASRDLEVPQIVTGPVCGIDKLSLVSPDPEVRCACEGRTRAIIDVAAELGAMVNVGRLRGRLDWMTGTADPWAYAVERLGELADYAAERGVRLALEPLIRFLCDFVHSTQDGLRFVRDAGRRNLGLMLDLFHMNVEDASIEGSLREAHEAGVLWHVHVADSNRLALGRGHLDIASIVSTVREIGYDGYLSAEQPPLPDPDEAARVTLERLRSLGVGDSVA